MGFFKSLKGDRPVGSGSPQNASNLAGSPEIYAPPPGPPPSHRQGDEQYAPPPGPPPGHESTEDNYASPPGPLSSHTDVEPPPYHDWTVIPDNALLPPPPSLGHERSPSSNANLSDADIAHAWCKAYPMIRPHRPTDLQHSAVAQGDVRLIKPKEYKGDLISPHLGFWKGSTRAGSKDACLVSSSPLYFAMADVPSQKETMKTIYFELKVRSLGRGRGAEDCSIAIGYCAMPYPTWRLPGWERGSLAVHSDDGRRYINNTWGGKDFTSPFQTGDTIGLGMTFSIPNTPPEYGTSPETATTLNVEVFLTRNGQKEETWNLHEELDADIDLGVDGLDGQFDLYGAMGTFGGVEFDVSFNRQEWLWLPR